MAPTTRSMCVRSRRASKPTTTRKTPKQKRSVPTRTVSNKRSKKEVQDSSSSSSSSSCSKSEDKEEDEIFPADLLPEWVLVHIFSFLSVKEKCRLTRVSKRWRFLIKDPRLWRLVTDSPDHSGDLLKFIRAYLGKSLWCFRPNTMTTAGLRLLDARCPHLKYLLVAFSDKTLHHFAHLDIDYLPIIDNVIIKGTKTKTGSAAGERRRLIFYLVSVRDPDNVNLPVEGFDELSLISRRATSQQQLDDNLQLALHHILVSKKWSLHLKDPRLWRVVPDSPQGSGDLLKFIRTFLGNSLWCFMPKTLTAAGLKLLENRCPKLKYLLVNYTFTTQAHHFRYLNLGLHFPVKANGVILRIPLSAVDKDLVGFLVVSKNLKRVDWNVIQRFEEFAPIVRMVSECTEVAKDMKNLKEGASDVQVARMLHRYE